MDKSIIEKYKNEMLNIRKRVAASSAQQGYYEEGKPDIKEDASNENGRIIAMVTYTDNIYPVKGAKVTVFTGSPENMEITDSDITDESGKTKTFGLAAPPRSLSQQSGTAALPYALYNIAVQADGFLDNIHLNIPVFSGITSVQKSYMLPNAVAGGRTDPVSFNEFSSFEL